VVQSSELVSIHNIRLNASCIFTYRERYHDILCKEDPQAERDAVEAQKHTRGE